MESIHKIIKLGNPLLRFVSEPIPEAAFGTDELRALERALYKMMKQESGIGLAAPQIGINQRAIVFGMDQHPIYKSDTALPFTTLFNPSYEPTSDVCEEAYEGCLSVGPLRAKVTRYKSIRYRGYDVNGQLIEQTASDLHARCVQHEVDHLNGIIFLDKVTNHDSLGFIEELLQSGAIQLNKTD